MVTADVKYSLPTSGIPFVPRSLFSRRKNRFAARTNNGKRDNMAVAATRKPGTMKQGERRAQRSLAVAGSRARARIFINFSENLTLAQLSSTPRGISSYLTSRLRRPAPVPAFRMKIFPEFLVPVVISCQMKNKVKSPRRGRFVNARRCLFLRGRIAGSDLS